MNEQLKFNSNTVNARTVTLKCMQYQKLQDIEESIAQKSWLLLLFNHTRKASMENFWPKQYFLVYEGKQERHLRLLKEWHGDTPPPLEGLMSAKIPNFYWSLEDDVGYTVLILALKMKTSSGVGA